MVSLTLLYRPELVTYTDIFQDSETETDFELLVCISFLFHFICSNYLKYRTCTTSRPRIRNESETHKLVSIILSMTLTSPLAAS